MGRFIEGSLSILGRRPREGGGRCRLAATARRQVSSGPRLRGGDAMAQLADFFTNSSAPHPSPRARPYRQLDLRSRQSALCAIGQAVRTARPPPGRFHPELVRTLSSEKRWPYV